MEEANGNQGNTATGERTRDILQGKLSPRVEDVERERERDGGRCGYGSGRDIGPSSNRLALFCVGLFGSEHQCDIYFYFLY